MNHDTMKQSGPITQLMYVSFASRELTQSDMDSILQKARATNQKRGVTGFLLFDGRAFMQLLEGPDSSVRNLFDIIERDPRHKGVHIIHQTGSNERLFSNWSMAYASLSSPLPTGFGGSLTKEMAQDIGFMLRNSDSSVRRIVADSLLHLAGVESAAKNSVFSAAP